MIKLTEKNLKVVTDAVLSQMVDENGRGEFDAETGVANAVSKMCNWLEHDVAGLSLLEQ